MTESKQYLNDQRRVSKLNVIQTFCSKDKFAIIAHKKISQAHDTTLAWKT